MATSATACMAVLSAASGVLLFASIGVGVWKAGLENAPPAYVLVPLVALCQAYHNAALAWHSTIASAAPAGDGGVGADGGGSPVSELLWAVHSYIAPLLMLSAWELAFTVFKTRAVPLGCLTFDSGVSGRRVAFVRVSAWLWSIAIHFLLQVEAERAHTGCGGTCARFRSGRIPWDALRFNGQTAADVLPPASLLLVGLTMGRSLWSYGSTASTDVHASSINSWAVTLASSAGLLCAYFLTPADWTWPLAVNAALVVLTAALTVTLHLVQVNRDQLAHWNVALEAAHDAEIADVARQQQAVRVRQVVTDVLAERAAGKELTDWVEEEERAGGRASSFSSSSSSSSASGRSRTLGAEDVSLHMDGDAPPTLIDSPPSDGFAPAEVEPAGQDKGGGGEGQGDLGPAGGASVRSSAGGGGDGLLEPAPADDAGAAASATADAVPGWK
jgi:hypothetical protein